MATDDSKLEILAGHYSDTFAAIQTSLKRRDRLFAGILILLFIMLFQLYAPQEALALISSIVADTLGSEGAVKYDYVQSALWFVLLASSIKYFQTVILVERQYNYIHQLESIISPEYGGDAFTREGASYLQDYPKFLNWAAFLYTILFPAILMLVSTAKIIVEFVGAGFNNYLVWFDGLMFLFLIVSVVLYMSVIHSKKKEPEDEQVEPNHHPES